MTSRPDDRNLGPERQAFDFELRRILESAIDSMPARYRAVLILRDVQGLSTSETAECLHMTVEATKVALHRARRRVRGLITRQVGGSFEQLFPFHATRCDAVVQSVFREITPRAN